MTRILDETLDKLEIYKDSNSSLNYRVVTDKKLAEKSEDELESMMTDITTKFQVLQKKTGIKVAEIFRDKTVYKEFGV